MSIVVQRRISCHRFFGLVILAVGIMHMRLAVAAPEESARPANKTHTTVALLADVKSIRPGSEFSVGVLMAMEPGWHTYWKNSGEAGLPTQLQWTLPHGITPGEIQWPLPHKYNESGEVITYGYEGENLLIVTMKVSDAFANFPRTTLGVTANWLECERVCIPGSASAELTLPVSRRQPEKSNAELFDRYRRQVPRSYIPGPDVSLSADAGGGAIEIGLTVTGSNSFVIEEGVVPDFYPGPVDDVVVGRTEVTGNNKAVHLRAALSAYEKVEGSRKLAGVVVYRLSSGRSEAAEIEIPLSVEFCATIPVVGQHTPTGSLLDRPFAGQQVIGPEYPLHLYILFAILGGLLLNVMPCVLPVIALKIFGLVRMAGDQPRQVKKLGWFFSLGILASFLALALLVILLQSAGEQVGWGFQFQEPLFVIAMSVIVFAFGLSLFGVYEIGLPFVLAFSSVGSALEARQSVGKGYVSSFSEGVFATVLATPCTAPFLGTALGFAFSQPASVILLVFSSVAFGMALPYLVLTARPAWMKFLPKPGGWMVTVKQLMGFLMMATLLWLLYILGKQLGMEAVIWTSSFLLVVGFACWLIGRFATLNAPRSTYAVTWLAAVAAVVIGYLMFLESILDVRALIAGRPDAAVQSEAPAGSGSLHDPDGIQWQAFSLSRLEQLLKDNKTVFIDFTAEWCLTCKVNEKTVMNDKDVVERFKTEGIEAIKADWTNRNPEITRLLAKFGRSGVPLYVIFPAGKPGEPIVLPEVITSGIVIDAIDRATSTEMPRI